MTGEEMKLSENGDKAVSTRLQAAKQHDPERDIVSFF